MSHNFADFVGVKTCFLEVTYLKIPVFFRKFYTWVELRETFLTGHQFTNLLNSVIPLRHDFFNVLAF